MFTSGSSIQVFCHVQDTQLNKRITMLRSCHPHPTPKVLDPPLRYTWGIKVWSTPPPPFCFIQVIRNSTFQHSMARQPLQLQAGRIEAWSCRKIAPVIRLLPSIDLTSLRLNPKRELFLMCYLHSSPRIIQTERNVTRSKPEKQEMRPRLSQGVGYFPHTTQKNKEKRILCFSRIILIHNAKRHRREEEKNLLCKATALLFWNCPQELTTSSRAHLSQLLFHRCLFVSPPTCCAPTLSTHPSVRNHSVSASSTASTIILIRPYPLVIMLPVS